MGGVSQNVNVMRTELANVSRTILDLLLKNDESNDCIQQLLTDISTEIVVQQLERVCYEKRTKANGEEQTLVAIDDLKHKEEYI